MSHSEDSPRKRERLLFHTTGKSRVDPSHAPSCDINGIVARFMRDGVLPRGKGPGQFIDTVGLDGDRCELVNRARDTMTEVREGLSLRAAEKSAAEEAAKLEDEQFVKKRRRAREVDSLLDQESAKK